MRVLLVNYEYPPLGGGGGILTRSLARELARSDDVCVLASRASGLERDTIEDGVRVVRVPVIGRNERERASPMSLATFVPSGYLPGFRTLDGLRPGGVH